MNGSILLVEDDLIDAMTFKRALKQLNISNKVVVAENGETALELLHDSSRQKPSLILLDLNMPRMNGTELLSAVKRDPALKYIPVIVLTTSGDSRDIRRSYENGAAGYMVKPVDYTHFVTIISTIFSYWRSCELPQERCYD